MGSIPFPGAVSQNLMLGHDKISIDCHRWDEGVQTWNASEGQTCWRLNSATPLMATLKYIKVFESLAIWQNSAPFSHSSRHEKPDSGRPSAVIQNSPNH